ncbi:lipid-A-disaccharide synthase [Legionella septentrionalis]|uniref:Lipid-A-disaccharide synthase n=1 Tax=Legionella septentrionalis TaxID=2498109 RepID=A0A433JJC4_9GAMM|nr:lipid-A-disaccharide synthase [Legionella septentrionalis]RUQ88329.1 lipid-A-disaccharide synthase [Legionella septentrionalis]
MRPVKHLVVVAGEESGDLHAASFIRELKLKYPELEISGIGGRHMQTAGVELISDLARFGVTGISEVFRHFKVIKAAFQKIKTHLATNKPDLLILVDYPGFNLRLAKFAKEKLGIRILYYISPQIWAWKAGRIHTIRKYIDHMAVILPFEKKIYEDAGVPVSYVGHPLVTHMPCSQDKAKSREQLGLPKAKRLIALLPGSRTHEIERHMPVLISTLHSLNQAFSDLHFTIPIAGTISPAVIKAYFKDTATDAYTLIQGQAPKVAACSDYVIVASGTASLECALLAKPMCIIYKASWLTYLLASQLIKVKYLGLCNLLKDKMLVPELLQYDCNSKELTGVMTELLSNEVFSAHMHRQLSQVKNSLSIHEADCTIAALIERTALLG